MVIISIILILEGVGGGADMWFPQQGRSNRDLILRLRNWGRGEEAGLFVGTEPAVVLYLVRG